MIISPGGSEAAMDLRLEPGVQAAIEAEARRAYPHEACGILLGHVLADHRVATRALVAANVAEPARLRDRYVVDPRAVLAAEREAAAGGLEIVGWFHSHPDHPAVPSAEDAARAWPWYVYVIASVRAGGVAEVRGWWLEQDGQFAEARVR